MEQIVWPDMAIFRLFRVARRQSDVYDLQRSLHRLWVSGEVYEPLRNSQKAPTLSLTTGEAPRSIAT